MLIAENKIIHEVLMEYHKIVPIFENNRDWIEMPDQDLWYELCLCILSSNVPYELARSALFHLIKNNYLQLDWINETEDSQQIIARELSKPIFLPKKVDGSCRKYRFPNVRSKNISSAARIIYSEEGWIRKTLSCSKSEEETRRKITENIPGIGLKESSHYLRNIKFSNQLAIIDSHVVSFLKEINIIEKDHVKTITPKIYAQLEKYLLNICESYGLNMSIFDMAIWKYMRR